MMDPSGSKEDSLKISIQHICGILHTAMQRNLGDTIDMAIVY